MAFNTGFWTGGVTPTQGTAANMNMCLLGWGLYSDFPAAAAGNKGMMALATDRGMVYYSDGSAWQQTAIVPPASLAQGDILYFNGTSWARLAASTSGYFLKTQGASANPVWAAHDSIPSGVIVMWSGTLANIPSGWVLCNGTNSTPDLRDRFIVGAAAGADPGSTGGALSKTTDGHSHILPLVSAMQAGTSSVNAGLATNSHTDSISDIRPPYFALAFIMKT